MRPWPPPRPDMNPLRSCGRESTSAPSTAAIRWPAWPFPQGAASVTVAAERPVLVCHLDDQVRISPEQSVRVLGERDCPLGAVPERQAGDAEHGGFLLYPAGIGRYEPSRCLKRDEVEIPGRRDDPRSSREPGVAQPVGRSGMTGQSERAAMGNFCVTQAAAVQARSDRRGWLADAETLRTHAAPWTRFPSAGKAAAVTVASRTFRPLVN